MKEVVIGERYEMLVMLGEVERVQDAAGRSWRMVAVRCDCGTEKAIRFANWQQKTISCGCFKRESMREIARERFSLQDGLAVANRMIYGMWGRMLSRCESPADKSYCNYGARGIKVCESWHDFKVFLADIQQELGPRPARYVFDRTNNDGNYEPGNVGWVSHHESNMNRRPRERWGEHT
jgi:hypothetical protein